MRWTIGAGIVAFGLVAAWLLLRRPVRQVLDEVRFDRARELFRMQREWLEARFLKALAQADPIERLRWEDACWHDEILWARDRPTRRLLALIGVHFDADPFSPIPEDPPRHATALFEFRNGRWHAEGKRLDELRPDEAFQHHKRFEPLVVPHRRA